jgi:hypothetical protein
MAKGATLAGLEAQQRAYTDASVRQYRAIMDTQGDDPYGSVPLTRRETDDRWLGLWFIIGMSADPVSVPFWAWLSTTRPVHEVGDLDLRCRKAWEDAERRDSAMAVVGDDLRAAYRRLRAVGLHGGQPRPRADAQGGS